MRIFKKLSVVFLTLVFMFTNTAVYAQGLSGGKSSAKPSDSFAANAVSGFGVEMNPQTGQPGITVTWIQLKGITEDMDLSLAMSRHDVAQTDDSFVYGLPKSWKWDIDYIEVKDEVLCMTGSASLKIDPSWKPSNLRYIKSKMLKMERFSGEGKGFKYDNRKYSYRLSMLDGSNEYFDSFGRLICVDDRFENCILYYYDKDAGIENSRLTKIIDSFDQEINFRYSGGLPAEEVIVTMPDGRKAECSFGIDKITLISPEGRKAEIKLWENGSIREIVYPAGGSIRYEYNDNAIDYKLAGDGPTQGFSAVSSVIEDPKSSGSDKMITDYDYRTSGRFYTGYPDYAFGSNALMESADNSFEFVTSIISRRFPENGGNLKTLKKFNHLNLALETDISQAGKWKQTITPKYAGQNNQGKFSPLSDLDSNYSRITETENKLNGRIINNEKLSYNAEGLISSSVERSDGVTATVDTTYFDKYGLEKGSTLADSADKSGKIITDNELDPLTGKYISESVMQRGDEKAVISTELDTRGRTILIRTNNLSGAKPSLMVVKYSYSYANPDKKYEFTTTTTDGLERETSVTVDTRNGFLIRETDAMGRITEYSYESYGDNKKGLVVKKTYPDKSWELIDDHDPKKTIRKKSSGYIMTEYLDGFGRPVKITDNKGKGGSERALYTYTYNELDEIGTKTDIFSKERKYFYSDWQGRQTKKVDHLGNETSIEYDDKNLIEAIKYNGIRVSKKQYNDNGDLVKSIDYLGGKPGSALYPVRQFAYNGKAQVVSTRMFLAPDIDSNGKDILSTISAYDLNDNEVSSTVKTSDGALSVAETEYNAFDFVNSSKITYKGFSSGVDGSEKTFGSEIKEYDAIGNVVKVTNALGESKVFEYDKNRNRISMTGFDKKKTEYAYDVMNRLVSVKCGTMSIVNEYFPAGIPAEGLIKSREFRIDGKLADRIEYEYNNRGLPVKTTYLDGKTRASEYDQYDRLISVIDIDGIKTKITYDRNIPENIIRIENSYASINYAYYPPEAKGFFGSGTVLKQVTYGNGVSVSYDYYVADKDSKNPVAPMLEKIIATGRDGVILSSFEYEYNERGHVNRVTRRSSDKDDPVTNNTREFTYNDNGWLISDETFNLSNKFVAKTAYTYDIRGNIVSQTVKGQSDEPAGKTTFEYDADNRLICSIAPDGAKTTYTYDPSGAIKAISLNGETIKSFEYNDFGQLARYSDKDGLDTSYSYNAQGLRSLKKDNRSGYSIAYYYNGNKEIVNETDSNGLKASTLLNLLRVVDGKMQCLISDAKDVVGYADGNASGLVEKYQFTAYGKEPKSVRRNAKELNAAPFSILNNPYGYCGYYKDEESGMCYLKTRSYSPDIMRFISRDSVGLTNRYVYADGNPVEMVDPHGQITTAIIALTAISVVTGVVGIGLTIAANSVEAKRPVSGYKTIRDLRISSYVFGGVSLVTGLLPAYEGAKTLVDYLKKKWAARSAAGGAAGGGVVGLAGGEAANVQRVSLSQQRLKSWQILQEENLSQFEQQSQQSSQQIFQQQRRQSSIIAIREETKQPRQLQQRLLKEPEKLSNINDQAPGKCEVIIEYQRVDNSALDAFMKPYYQPQARQSQGSISSRTLTKGNTTHLGRLSDRTITNHDIRNVEPENLSVYSDRTGIPNRKLQQ